jgi:hypothetical protein
MKLSSREIIGIARHIGRMVNGLLLFGLLVPSTQADSSSAAAFLKIQPSVRNYALGGNHPALSFGSQAIGSNPGNLVLQKTPYELTTSFASLIGGSGYGHFAASLRDGNTAWGAHMTYLRSGTLEGRDDNGAMTSSFTGQDYSAGVSFAEKFGKSFRAGLTAKAVRESIGTESSNTPLAADVGASYSFPHVLAGLSANNLGGKLKMGTASAALPASYNGGIAFGIGEMTALVGVGKWANEGTMYVNGGLEYKLGPLSLRAGYRNESGTNLALKAQKGGMLMDGITGGLGFQRAAWKLDYAIAQNAAEYGMSQRAAVTFMWGGTPENRTTSSFNQNRTRLNKTWVK